jgi:xanthine dehydrogenase small subunit
MIADIKVQSVKRLREAYSWLDEFGGSGKVLAGGTDLMVYLNARSLMMPAYLDIWRLEELRTIEDEGNSILLGALTTYTDIIKSSIVGQYAPILVDASRTVGAVQIQNRGTIGGNIVNASPAGDTLPVFSAFDADLVIGSSEGRRTVPFNEFYTDYRKTTLASNELLLGVRLHKRNLGAQQGFRKVGTRRAQAISKTVIAINSKIENNVIESIRISLGSVAPTVIRAPKTEEFLIDRTLTNTALTDAADLLKSEISPIDDIRSTAHYRKTVSANVFRRLLQDQLAKGK